MTTYRISYPSAGRLAAPPLDEHQRAVVDHPGGPLLVLAGPGTGKTTTLVEAIVDRIENRGADPSQVLALTFSRKAAEQLRDRVTARLGRTMNTTLSSTFHSFAYGLVRRWSPAEVYAAPLRLLTAAEQDVILQRLARPVGTPAERVRILPAAHHKGVIIKNGDVAQTVLVDGMVAGTWALVAKPREAVVTVAPFGRIARAAKAEILEEGERLARLLAPEARAHGARV